eukprot:scaffold55875_cov26-Tisochrysis_lutea.AAC.5
MGQRVGKSRCRGAHLRPAKLILRGIDLAAEELVERAKSSEEHRAVLHLDDTLGEAVNVCADADGAAGDVREGERLGVGGRGLAGNEAGAAQVFNADSVLLADDVVEDIPLTLARNVKPFAVEVCARIEAVGVLLGEVQVLEALADVLRIVPLNLEVGLKFVGEADACARVGGNVQPREAEAACILRDFIKELVLSNAKGARLNSAVVGHNHEGTALRILRRLDGDVPADHADLVLADRARATVKGSGIVDEELIGLQQIGGHRLRRAIGDCGLPFSDNSFLEESEEVVRVGGADAAGDGALGSELRGDRVWLDVAHALLAVLKRTVRCGDAGDRVEILDITVGLEPLAAHRGCHKSDRLALAIGILRVHPDLDLVDGKLEEASCVLRDEAGHDLFEPVDELCGRLSEWREDV